MDQDHMISIGKNLGIVALSILVAIILAETGILKDLLTVTQEIKLLGSFIAGIFFISMFTAAPATVILFELFQNNSIFEVALMAALGALAGDFLIFKFAKDSLSEDLKYLAGQARPGKASGILRSRTLRWLMPAIGAIIVASPFPDEIGIALMGLSGIRTSLFIPLSFILNFAGILAIGLIVK